MAQVYAPRTKTVEQEPLAVPRLSLEVLAYIGILLLAFALRGLALDVIPLDHAQAHEAVASFQRINPDVPGETIYPYNALGGFFNSLFMLFLGASDAVVRFPTVLAGLLLVLTPLLYRRYTGRTYAVLLAVFLAINPVSVAASRTMSGVIWAMLLVMIGGWLLLRYIETRQRWYALATGVCAMGVLFLTTPVGILILPGLLLGVALAVLTAPPDDDARRLLPEVARVFPGFEAIVMALVAATVISTFFFLSPSGLSSIGQVPQAFMDGLTTRPAGTPIAYGMLITLRYDLGFFIFGVIALMVALRDGNFRERFLAGWLLWSIISVTVYPGASPDIALLVSVPAVALTASLALRMGRNVSFGFWQVPGWVLPAHALATAALLTGLVINLQSLSVKLWREADIVDYAKVLELYNVERTAHIGTLKALPVEGSSMAMSLPAKRYINCIYPTTLEEAENLVQMDNGQYCEELLQHDITLRVFPIDEGIEDAHFTIKTLEGTIYYGPERIGEDGLTIFFEVPEEAEYRFDITRTPAVPGDEPLQYGFLINEGDLASPSGLERISSGAFLLDMPNLALLLRVSSRHWSPLGPVIVILILLILLPMLFFLVGAFYGARAAWRGMGFGALLFIALYGMGLGWQATVLYGNNIRELWHTGVAPDDYHTMRQTLDEMSRRATGTRNEVPITVEGDSTELPALVWALRDFEDTRFVDQVGYNTTTPIVIAPETTPPPTLGADYVGRRLILDYRWNLSSMNWTDFGGWLFTRRSRIEPVASDYYRLWVERELYDVEKVPGQE